MKVLLATLCLNEMEWLPRLWAQHRGWPFVCRWVFVEAADPAYAAVDPGTVTADGLSTDGTTEHLASLAGGCDRVTHVKHGWMKHEDRAQAKCSARNRYLEIADAERPDLVVVLDADESYTWRDQAELLRVARRAGTCHQGIMLRQRHAWRPPSASGQPLFRHEVQGGYWDVPHCRVWTWRHGMRHTHNHNTPNGVGSIQRLDLDRVQAGLPQCVHVGFAGGGRAQKSAYYEARGEGGEGGRLGAKRRMYVECRRAHAAWNEGDALPHGAMVVPWTAPIPECFQEQQL